MVASELNRDPLDLSGDVGEGRGRLAKAGGEAEGIPETEVAAATGLHGTHLGSLHTAPAGS